MTVASQYLVSPSKCYLKVKTFSQISRRRFFEEGRDAGRGCVFGDPLPYALIPHGVVFI